MSPQARYAYPDDEAVALRWLEHGDFPHVMPSTSTVTLNA